MNEGKTSEVDLKIEKAKDLVASWGLPTDVKKSCIGLLNAYGKPVATVNLDYTGHAAVYASIALGLSDCEDITIVPASAEDSILVASHLVRLKEEFEFKPNFIVIKRTGAKVYFHDGKEGKEFNSSVLFIQEDIPGLKDGAAFRKWLAS